MTHFKAQSSKFKIQSSKLVLKLLSLCSLCSLGSLFLFIVLGCESKSEDRGQKTENRKQKTENRGQLERSGNPATAGKTEDGSQTNIKAYIFADKELYVVSLDQNKVKKIHLPSKVSDVFLSSDTIWVAGGSTSSSVLFYLTDGEQFIKYIDLPSDYTKIIKSTNGIYVLKRDALLRLPDQRRLTFTRMPIKFDVLYGKIWAIDDDGFSVYRETDFKELHRIPLDKPLDFALATYGIRVYIATSDRLTIFDTQTAKYITEIPIESGERAVIKFIDDKLFCLTHSALYKIDKTSNRIESRIQIDDDVTDIATNVQSKRIYCLTPVELIAISAEKLQIISKLELTGGRRIIIK